TMHDVEFVNITSSGDGAAIHAAPDTEVEIYNFVFANNKARTGFAIYTEANLVMRYGTFEDNNRYSDDMIDPARAMIFHTGEVLVVDDTTFFGTDMNDNYVYSTARVVLRNINYP